MALSDLDRNLIQRCLADEPRAWEDFVDRFLGLVIHVINHSADSRSQRLTAQDREDLAADVFLAIVNNELAVLRRFRGDSSLATYLTVIARRVVVRELLQHKTSVQFRDMDEVVSGDGHRSAPEERIASREEVERLLESLSGPEAQIVRMYHLEGKSYGEISAEVGLSENSIGPTLSRARAKLRQVSSAGSGE